MVRIGWYRKCQSLNLDPLISGHGSGILDKHCKFFFWRTNTGQGTCLLECLYCHRWGHWAESTLLSQYVCTSTAYWVTLGLMVHDKLNSANGQFQETAWAKLTIFKLIWIVLYVGHFFFNCLIHNPSLESGVWYGGLLLQLRVLQLILAYPIPPHLLCPCDISSCCGDPMWMLGFPAQFYYIHTTRQFWLSVGPDDTYCCVVMMNTLVQHRRYISKNQHFLFHLIQSYYILFLLFWG